MEICERDYPFVISDRLRPTGPGTPTVTPAKAGVQKLSPGECFMDSPYAEGPE